MDYRYARQSTGWFYLFFTPFIHVVYRLLFRKIYLHNRRGVKPNTPVLIAANHPTAFIDPIFFTSFFDPPVYNMTRGDIFRKPLFRKFLMSCNMFPVFRQRDGYQGRDRNDEVFEFCQQKLLSRVAVNIFVEGEHHLDKRVLSMQKGIARIAFGTYERHRMEDLQIVPVGCNYIYGDRTRDEAKIIVGTPLFVKDYWADYEQNPGATINKLCRDIQNALKRLCYHIDSKADDALAEQLLTLWRSDNPAMFLPIVEHQAPRYFGEKALLDQLNILPETEKEALREKAGEYFEALEQAGLNDEGLAHPDHAKPIWTLFLFLTAPIAISGFLIGWPVRWLVYTTARRTVKKREFYTSVLMGLAVIYGGFYLLGLVVTGFITDSPSIITFALIMPLLAWLSIFWKETLFRWRSAILAKKHPARAQLLALRKAIRE
jgi:1-acyl-sn-glycerol-3-phosphate acyltransferase